MKQGDFIKIDYEARVVNTELLFDTTKPELALKNDISGAEGPETIIVGERYVIKGLDEELEKHSVGDEFEVNILAEKAFGQRRTELVKIFPKQLFHKEQMNPIPGLVVNFLGLQGKILSASGGRVRVDFNHPMAGKAVKYKVKILEKVEKDEEKIEAIIKSRLRTKPDIKTTKDEIIVTTEKELQKPTQDMLLNEIKKYVIHKIKFEHK